MESFKEWSLRWAKFSGIGIGISVALGVGIALIGRWPLIQGVYNVFFGLAVLCMLYAATMFVGTPVMRYDYLVRGKKLRRQGKAEEVEPMENQGILPAILGVTFAVLGFLLEALTH